MENEPHRGFISGFIAIMLLSITGAIAGFIAASVAVYGWLLLVG